MLFDYNHYVSKREEMHLKIPSKVSEEKIRNYWAKLIQNVIAYVQTRQIQLYELPDWRQKIEGNPYYKYITDKYDKECQELIRLYRNQ
jgi:hypothetical protein